jgi:hypothetical protein
LENRKGKHHLKNLGVDGRVILKWILGEMRWEGEERIYLTQERDQ